MAAKKRPRACRMLAHDIKRIAGIGIDVADGYTIQGAIFGPPGRRLLVDFECSRPADKWGPTSRIAKRPAPTGPGAERLCATYRIKRSGPAVSRGLVTGRADTGNIFGLVGQLSRDVVKIWGCAPGPERGFEGGRRRR